MSGFLKVKPHRPVFPTNEMQRRTVHMPHKYVSLIQLHHECEESGRRMTFDRLSLASKDGTVPLSSKQTSSQNFCWQVKQCLTFSLIHPALN